MFRLQVCVSDVLGASDIQCKIEGLLSVTQKTTCSIQSTTKGRFVACRRRLVVSVIVVD